MASKSFDLQNNSFSLFAGGSGSSPLTTSGSNGFLANDRSPLNEPLLQKTTSRASASTAAISDPGNTRNTAYKIGSLDAVSKTFTDSVASTDQNDYYQFSISKSSRFKLTLTGLKADANVQLLSSTGTLLNQSTQVGTANESLSRTLAPGTYYVRVYQSTGSTPYTLGLSAATVSSNAGDSNPRPGPTGTADFVQQVLNLTNQFRAQNGLAPLRLNAELNAAALAHSKDMALKDYFSHTGKNGSSPGDRLKAVGYESQAWGENIAAGYSTPEQVVQGWINSPGHRANLLNRSYTELGVGYYNLANDTGSVNYNNYWTQDFGSGDRNPSSNVPAA